MADKNMTKWEPKLIGEYDFGECASALQKSIRRGMEYEACYWAYIFHASGYGEYLWRRLSTICAEDIGNGDPQTHILLNALRESWQLIHKRVKYHTNDKFLFVVQSILFMCRAKKSRENDSLVNLIDEHWKQGKRFEIPRYAIDPHCDRGKEEFGKFGDMEDGKEETRIEMWFSEWSKVNNLAYPDKWQEELKELWLRNITEYNRKDTSQDVAFGQVVEEAILKDNIDCETR